MKENASALFSPYIIDGVRQDFTPAELLGLSDEEKNGNPFVDETLDPSPSRPLPDDTFVDYCLEKVSRIGEKPFPMVFSSQYSRISVCNALTEVLWRKGNFRLGDLCLDLCWGWNDNAIGNMSAFYNSAAEAADALESLGLSRGDISFHETAKIYFEACARLHGSAGEEDFDLLDELPFHSHDPKMEDVRALPSTFTDDSQSWIIYIPFDTCDFRLGGSKLAVALDAGGDGTAPRADDADYFQDCFEVVREMVEDGVAISGNNITQGGLICALEHMRQGQSLSVDLSALMKEKGEKSAIRMLFSEVPGVVLQIKDIDYDYFDAEMLLQDVVYFPLGHPGVSRGNLKIENAAQSSLHGILQAILSSQAGEGED